MQILAEARSDCIVPIVEPDVTGHLIEEAAGRSDPRRCYCHMPALA